MIEDQKLDGTILLGVRRASLISFIMDNGEPVERRRIECDGSELILFFIGDRLKSHVHTPLNRLWSDLPVISSRRAVVPY